MLFLAYPAIIVKRLLNEEQVLREELDGCEAYTHKVRRRPIPFVR